MNPFADARAVYSRELCARTFEEDLSLHLHFGYVYSDPECFVMGRPVDSSAPPERVLDPSFVFPREVQDCWLIYLAAGDVTKIWTKSTYDLPLLGWERGNKLRFYATKRVAKTCEKFRLKTPAFAGRISTPA